MRTACFFCKKRTTNMKFHLKRCTKFVQISNDVFEHEIMSHIRIYKLTKTLHTHATDYLKLGCRNTKVTKELINERNIQLIYDKYTIDFKKWFTSPFYGQKYMKSYFFFENQLSFGILCFNYKRENNYYYKFLYFPDHYFINKGSGFNNNIQCHLNVPHDFYAHGRIVEIVKRLMELNKIYCTNYIEKIYIEE